MTFAVRSSSAVTSSPAPGSVAGAQAASTAATAKASSGSAGVLFMTGCYGAEVRTYTPATFVTARQRARPAGRGPRGPSAQDGRHAQVDDVALRALLLEVAHEQGEHLPLQGLGVLVVEHHGVAPGREHGGRSRVEHRDVRVRGH